jgi:hypothetical protein|tara:strand:+ start:64 stop:414 length:351 start_codon:yes stop_codon:yes gene_type:complete
MNEERIVDSIRGDDLEVGVEIKQHFGSYRAYPFTPAAKIIARMVNKKTLNRNDLALAMKLGFRISVAGCAGFLPEESLIDTHGVVTLGLPRYGNNEIATNKLGEYGHGNPLWNVQI